MSSRLTLTALLAPALCLTLHASSAAAYACGSDAATRWLPQRSWPSACEPDAVTDGLVLLDGDALPSGAPGGDGELKVTIDRIFQGNAVETFTGKVSRPDATSALFQSERPLAPQSNYQINAVRVGADGSELGPKFTSAFTTGVRALSPLSFTGTPSLTYEEAETERFDCVLDQCGQKNCKPSDEQVHIKSVRIAVPSIVGGVDLKPLSVSAKLVASFANGQAPAVATSDTTATASGKRSFIVLELPALPSAADGCVTISAVDAAGHTLSSAPVCTSLPADDAPYDQDDQGVPVLSQLGLAQSADTANASDNVDLASTAQAATAQASASAGCSVGQGNASLGNLGWLALALTLVRLRVRRPQATRHPSR